MTVSLKYDQSCPSRYSSKHGTANLYSERFAPALILLQLLNIDVDNDSGLHGWH